MHKHRYVGRPRQVFFFTSYILLFDAIYMKRKKVMMIMKLMVGMKKHEYEKKTIVPVFKNN